jgi:hypothetical protein
MVMHASSSSRAGALLMLLIACGACSKPAEPVRITGIELGSTINTDNTVSSPNVTFPPNATVYASIATEGTGSGTLASRWIGADDQVFTEQTQSINPTKPAYFEFHFVAPGGWPKGRHKVVFTLNGGGTRTREFEIR